jgi:hypothetical protein
LNYRIASQNMGGRDFLVYWVAIRSLITEGNSPYSDGVSREILALATERASNMEGFIPQFNIPIYAGIIVLPFAFIGDFNWAYALWLTAQQIALAVAILSTLYICGGGLSKLVFVVLIATSLFGYHSLAPQLRGSMVIWIVMFIPLFFLSIRADRQELAGILLALMTVQPLLVIFLVLFGLGWSLSQRKYLVIVWFFGGLGFLSVIGLFLVPAWIMEYLRILWHRSLFFTPGAPGEVFRIWWPGVGAQLGWVLTGALALIMIFEWWLAWRKDFRWFFWTACLTMTITQWIGVPTTPLNFVVLVIPLILIIVTWETRWAPFGRWIAIVCLLLVFGWEWALFYHNMSTSQSLGYLNLLFPFPLVVLIGLYWVRWGATRPRRLLAEELRSADEG